MSGRSSERLSFEPGVFLKTVSGGFFLVMAGGVLGGKVTVVLWLYFPALVRGNVTSGENPRKAEGGETHFDFAGVGRVAPGATGIVNPDGFVDFNAIVGVFGLGKADLAERDADLGMDHTWNVDLAAVRKNIGDGAGFAGGGVGRSDHRERTEREVEP